VGYDGEESEGKMAHLRTVGYLGNSALPRHNLSWDVMGKSNSPERKAGLFGLIKRGTLKAGAE